jgi:hypothetical protein
MAALDKQAQLNFGSRSGADIGGQFEISSDSEAI